MYININSFFSLSSSFSYSHSLILILAQTHTHMHHPFFFFSYNVLLVSPSPLRHVPLLLATLFLAFFFLTRFLVKMRAPFLSLPHAPTDLEALMFRFPYNLPFRFKSYFHRGIDVNHPPSPFFTHASHASRAKHKYHFTAPARYAKRTSSNSLVCDSTSELGNPLLCVPPPPSGVSVYLCLYLSISVLLCPCDSASQRLCDCVSFLPLASPLCLCAWRLRSGLVIRFPETKTRYNQKMIEGH